MTRKVFPGFIFTTSVFICALVSFAGSLPFSSNGTKEFNGVLYENETLPVEGTARMQTFSGLPSLSWSSLITARKKDLFMDFLKFLLQRLLTKKWTTELAIKRLDKVKTSLIKYYAKRNIFQTEISSARDKAFGFPSLEGALLSLAFLTFSVFLIDLIQTLLTKLRMTTTAPTAAPALSSYLGGRSRTGSLLKSSSKLGLFESDESFEDERMTTLSSKVLSAIERPFQNYS
ncbi:unnamed protein product [Orchesella dallaii]|uniref:Uncharacterized protein n=1 Tax=Orchesella dallaii TaxID=48710 RepID=A0ABP1RS95_9HEXA